MNPFKTKSGTLRNIWWVAIFFFVLAAITFPAILFSQRYKWEISIVHQAVIVIAANWICQLLRKKPLHEITGRFNYAWLKNFLRGLITGAVLMLTPAVFLYSCGWVYWESGSADLWPLLPATGLVFCVAVAEEFLFRGFAFQRLMDSAGVWVAQLIMAGYFLLTHLNNPGMDGAIKLLASVNIFLAAIMFGQTFIKTKSLAMSIGIHFMANWVQGSLLGLGVSGHEETGILKPVFGGAPVWLTGGEFGLEGSLPGLVTLLAIITWLYVRPPRNN